MHITLDIKGNEIEGKKTTISPTLAVNIIIAKESQHVPKTNRLVNSNLKAFILYDSETWRIAISTTNKIHAFINKYQKHILQIKWPGKMRNE